MSIIFSGQLSPGLLKPVEPLDIPIQEQQELGYMMYRDDFERVTYFIVVVVVVAVMVFVAVVFAVVVVVDVVVIVSPLSLLLLL